MRVFVYNMLGMRDSTDLLRYLGQLLFLTVVCNYSTVICRSCVTSPNGVNVETQPLRLTQAKRPMIAYFDFEADRTRQSFYELSVDKRGFLILLCRTR